MIRMRIVTPPAQEREKLYPTDPDVYLSMGDYILSHEATLEFVQENAEKDNIKVKIDQACQLIDETLTEYKFLHN